MTGSWDYNAPHASHVYFLPLSSALAVTHKHTHTSQLDLPLHICTHTHTPAAHTQVCTNYRDKKSFVWELHLTSVY